MTIAHTSYEHTQPSGKCLGPQPGGWTLILRESECGGGRHADR
jgi:hypothetical protein